MTEKKSISLSYPRPWMNRYGAVVVLLMLLLVMNPELRVFLLVTNYIGVDLMIFFIALQLRYLLPAIPLLLRQMRAFLCVASFAILRGTLRVVTVLLAPSRITVGLTALLFVLSWNTWCPTPDQGFREP
jgi:hypothetical protein